MSEATQWRQDLTTIVKGTGKSKLSSVLYLFPNFIRCAGFHLKHMSFNNRFFPSQLQLQKNRARLIRQVQLVKTYPPQISVYHRSLINVLKISSTSLKSDSKIIIDQYLCILGRKGNHYKKKTSAIVQLTTQSNNSK